MLRNLLLLVVSIFLMLSCKQLSDKRNKNNEKSKTSGVVETKSFNNEGTADFVAELLNSKAIEGHSYKLYNPTILDEFYARRGNLTAWTSFKNIEDALSALYQTYDDGLDPQDYRYGELKELYSDLRNDSNLDKSAYAQFDVMLSDALLTAAAHLVSGKVNPASLKNQWSIEVVNYNQKYQDIPGMLQKALDNESIKEEVEKLKPSHYMYTGLKQALKDFRKFELNGGWDSIPEGKTIKKGEHDARVPLLRKRLLASGEMEPYQPADSTVYDARLFEIIKLVQKKYGIVVDGNLGKSTVEALNMSVDYRIQQIRANLERGRWVLQDLEKKYIAVNIAGFELYLIDDGLEVLTSPVMVGRYQTQTPVFKSTMSYIVLNPTWTVPRSLNAQYIANQKKNPSYLDKENMEVVTYSGKVLDHKTLKWEKYNEANFPYMFRQSPGPKNALGEMKFMFPNDYSIYLHDTPSRGLFTRDLRAFSHGCIRTKEIHALAEELLKANNEGWTQAKLKKELASGKTITVNLKERIPILLLYWTAGIGFNQNFYFKSDIYHRDDALIDALNQPFAYQ